MGNEQSQLSGIEIEEKAVEVSDFWLQHTASTFNSEKVTNLSIFIGELFVSGPLWSSQTPLEKNSKNLMIYRHPCIVKYISSWQKSSKFFLAVEEVKPLSHILSTLNTLQICIGLHSILKALCFLHDKAFVSHNNVCTASIYVTKDGSWKLGGMEYLCRFADLNCDYLSKARSHRYSKAVDANEDKHVQNISSNRKDFVDAYAFGVLVCEVLRSKKDDEIETLSNFRELCGSSLQNVNISQRPQLNSLLEHEFFNHEFIAIHSFLVELPLKSDEDKTQFFLTLPERLKGFSEVVVGNQLGNLLLSRMVLLNKTAQINLLPVVLSPRQDDQSIGLFCEDTFKKYLVPKLLEIFTVRDAQIRLLLLNHFAHFIQTFTKEELQTCILPELLVGIKDTNDHLVAVTLKTLADLVPILGAATVIGGKRAKLFNDGRPIQHPGRKPLKLKRSEIVLPLQASHDQIILSSGIEFNQTIELPERPRPDGEEVDTSTEEVEPSVDEDLDNWEDWGTNDHHENTIVSTTVGETLHIDAETGNEATLSEGDENFGQTTVEISLDGTRQNRLIPDIVDLDIKNQQNEARNGDDIDFFQDMEPVIQTSNKFLIDEEPSDLILEKLARSKLTLNAANDVNEEGWGDEDWE